MSLNTNKMAMQLKHRSIPFISHNDADPQRINLSDVFERRCERGSNARAQSNQSEKSVTQAHMRRQRNDRPKTGDIIDEQ